jgi:hypothetical protein
MLFDNGIIYFIKIKIELPERSRLTPPPLDMLHRVGVETVLRVRDMWFGTPLETVCKGHVDRLL